MRPSAVRHGVALGAAAIAFAIVRVLHPVLDGASYMVFVAAVAAVVVFAGFVPALVTILLSIAAIDFFFLAPVHSLTLIAAADVGLLALFGGVALIVSWLTELLHRRRARVEQQALRAAGVAELLQRHAAELEQDVDALHALRSAGRRAK